MRPVRSAFGPRFSRWSKTDWRPVLHKLRLVEFRKKLIEPRPPGAVSASRVDPRTSAPCFRERRCLSRLTEHVNMTLEAAGVDACVTTKKAEHYTESWVRISCVLPVWH